MIENYCLTFKDKSYLFKADLVDERDFSLHEEDLPSWRVADIMFKYKDIVRLAEEHEQVKRNVEERYKVRIQ